MPSRRGRPGAARRERKTAVQERAEALGIEVRTPRTLRDAEEQARFRGARRRSRGGRRLRADPAQADPRRAQGAAASTSTPRCCRAGAARRRSSARSSPATRSAASRIMQMDEGLDTGPMLLDARARHSRQERRASHGRTGETWRSGADRMARRIRLAPEPQPDRRRRPTPPRSTRPRRGSTGRRPPSRSSGRCAPSIRRPGAWFEVDGERIKLLGLQRRLDRVRGNAGRGCSTTS